jgi:hypothetical protein
VTRRTAGDETIPLHRRNERPWMTWLSTGTIPGAATFTAGSSAITLSDRPAETGSSTTRRVRGISYCRVSCFSPGARAATMTRESPERRIAAAETSPSLNCNPTDPFGKAVAHEPRLVSVATRVRVPLLRRMRRSSTPRPSLPPVARVITRWRASSSTGAELEVSYTTIRRPVSGLAGLVASGEEKYSMPAYRPLTR